MAAKRKSWKTSTSGIVAALGVVLAFVSTLVDGDASTIGDPAGAIQALGVLMAALGVGAGGMFARDDDVSSEGRVAPKSEKPLKP